MQKMIKIIHVNLKINKNFNINIFELWLEKLIWCYLKNFNKALMKI